MPYFGKWPQWFPIYLASCKTNPTIRWHFYTDCPIPIDPPSNFTFCSMTFDNYKEKVSQKLRIAFKPEDYYKIYDIRPALGIIHEEDINGFDYFG
jgi:hypothetical protein